MSLPKNVNIMIKLNGAHSKCLFIYVFSLFSVFQVYMFFLATRKLSRRTPSVCVCSFFFLFSQFCDYFYFWDVFFKLSCWENIMAWKGAALCPSEAHLKLWENTPTRRQILKACFGAFDPPLKYYLIQNHIYTLFFVSSWIGNDLNKGFNPLLAEYPMKRKNLKMFWCMLIMTKNCNLLRK